MRKILKTIGIVVLLAVLILLSWVFMNLKDRHRGYKADLSILPGERSILQAGFSAVAITPEVPDRWTDVNNDAGYDPDDGDIFTDCNGNGRFDPVWIAGFGNKRAANGIHDDLWARSVVFDDGKTRLAIVSLDAIGFMNNDVIDVRQRIPSEAGITYVVITSTHTHEGPDLLGLWGRSILSSGIDGKYLELVKERIVESIVAAVEGMRPVRLEISEDPAGAVPLVRDTREPSVFDSGLRMIRAIGKDNGETIGSVIAWGNHPETLWGKNLLITSDFPHYVRECVEKGVFNGDSLVKEGIGGIAIYVNGAVGGLMTTSPSVTVKDPVTGSEFKEPSFDKALAQGRQLALLVLDAMRSPLETIDSCGISLIVRTLPVPIKNKVFRLALSLGILKRGTQGWMKARTELAVFKIGPLSFATLPGEVYPEILNGGIEAPDGRDFSIEPVEVPPVRDMMTGRFKFILGLANDEIGYILPKSQWDTEAPYTYGRSDPPYGEENSMGPETAPILHLNLKEMLSEMPDIH